MVFTRGITLTRKQLENNIDKMNTEMTKGSTSSNAQDVSQLKKHQTINNSDRMETFASQEAKTEIAPKSATLLIQNSKT